MADPIADSYLRRLKNLESSLQSDQTSLPAATNPRHTYLNRIWNIDPSTRRFALSEYSNDQLKLIASTLESTTSNEQRTLVWATIIQRGPISLPSTDYATPEEQVHCAGEILPPRNALYLLKFVKTHSRESLEGDLLEEFREIAADARQGVRRANLWFWAQVLNSCASSLKGWAKLAAFLKVAQELMDMFRK